MVSMRKAALKDLEVMYEIELECFGHDAFSRRLLEYFIRSPDYLNLIAFLDGKPAGFITASVGESRGGPVCHIYTLDVKSDFRRKGIGSSLLASLEHILAEKNVEACYLEVRADNEPAKNLYVKNGYRPQEGLKDYYGFRRDGIRYRKNLKPT